MAVLKFNPQDDSARTFKRQIDRPAILILKTKEDKVLYVNKRTSV
jgi:hypothetical protein